MVMPEAVAQGFGFARLLLTLGLEVYKAVTGGEPQKTVQEIFDGAVSDMSEIERLELERFGAE